VVHLSIALADHVKILGVIACQPMWQNQTITNSSCPHINAELLLVSTQHSFSRNSQNKYLGTHVDMDIFSHFGMWNWCPKFVGNF
jgi:hypothetical protein